MEPMTARAFITYQLRKQSQGALVSHLRNCEPWLTEQNNKSYLQGFEIMPWLRQIAQKNPRWMATIENPSEAETQQLDALWHAFDYKRTQSRMQDDHRGHTKRTTKLQDIYEWEDYACEALGMTKEAIRASTNNPCRCEFCREETLFDRSDKRTAVA